MNLKILYDNEAVEGFRKGWGFSALIDDEILFDTGENADALLANMQAFGIQPHSIRHVVLSHADWDHVGGIAALSECKGLKVYLPSGTPETVRNLSSVLDRSAEILEIVKPTNISADLFLTARLGTRKKEISLCVRTAQGLALITGCAHPGLARIMRHVSRFGDIHAVIGGFHGFSRLKALAGVPVILPCHCTRKMKQIQSLYPDRTRLGFAGLDVVIGA